MTIVSASAVAKGSFNYRTIMGPLVVQTTGVRSPAPFKMVLHKTGTEFCPAAPSGDPPVAWINSWVVGAQYGLKVTSSIAPSADPVSVGLRL